MTYTILFLYGVTYERLALSPEAREAFDVKRSDRSSRSTRAGCSRGSNVDVEGGFRTFQAAQEAGR